MNEGLAKYVELSELLLETHKRDFVSLLSCQGQLDKWYHEREQRLCTALCCLCKKKRFAGQVPPAQTV